MKRKPGLTLEEHRDLGILLKQVRSTLLTQGVSVANKYPKGSRVARLALAAHAAVDKLRVELDSVVHAENRTEPRMKDVYF